MSAWLRPRLDLSRSLSLSLCQSVHTYSTHTCKCTYELKPSSFRPVCTYTCLLGWEFLAATPQFNAHIDWNGFLKQCDWLHDLWMIINGTVRGVVMHTVKAEVSLHPRRGRNLWPSRFRAGCWWMVAQRKFSRSTVCSAMHEAGLSTWLFSCLLRSICLVLAFSSHSKDTWTFSWQVAACFTSAVCLLLLFNSILPCRWFHLRNLVHALIWLLTHWALCWGHSVMYFSCGSDESGCPFLAGFSSDRTQARTVTVAGSFLLKGFFAGLYVACGNESNLV